MERRDFLKISAAGGAAAALEGCGNPDHHLIRFIPEEDLVPGIATWKPSICTQCPAGCGLLVRVMQGDAEVVRKGQLGILKMGLAKKLEGNPAHPINQGKLCPRGQAGLQVTYHPDRIKGPMTRSGARGSGQFKQISWDDAMKQLVGQLSALQNSKQENGLAFVTSPLRGQRKTIVDSFAAGFKSLPPVEFGFLDNGVIREANLRSFGVASLPTVDLGQSNYVISFGADFLGTWNSPVAQAIGYGRMRNGRPGQRGKLVQVEPRISQTGASADEWIPSPGGTEGIFALSLANVILQEKLRPAAAAGARGRCNPGMVAGIGRLRTRKGGKTGWGTSRHHCQNCSRGCRECAGSGVDRRCGCGTVEWPLQRAGGECVERAAGQRGKTGRNPFQLRRNCAAGQARNRSKRDRSRGFPAFAGESHSFRARCCKGAAGL